MGALRSWARDREDLLFQTVLQRDVLATLAHVHALRKTVAVAMPELNRTLRELPAEVTVARIEVGNPKAFWQSAELLYFVLPVLDECIDLALDRIGEFFVRTTERFEAFDQDVDLLARRFGDAKNHRENLLGLLEREDLTAVDLDHWRQAFAVAVATLIVGLVVSRRRSICEMIRDVVQIPLVPLNSGAVFKDVCCLGGRLMTQGF